MRAIDLLEIRVALVVAVAALLLPGVGIATGQPVPQPFPRPGGQPPDPAAPTAPAPQPPVAVPVDPPAAQGALDAPTSESLGIPIYPTAEYLTSYSAGRGQRFYLFGSNLSFTEMVAYYRSILDQRGNMLFDTPPTYMFDVGRYDEDRMAFRPSVTIKDFTWSGSLGYPNPVPGIEPMHFKTIVQIVPRPSGMAAR